MNIYLAVIKAYDPGAGSETTLYYGTQGFQTGPSDTPANTVFKDYLLQPALLSRQMFSSGTTFGESRVSYGDLVLTNTNGDLDDIADYAYDGRDLEVYYGPKSGTFPGDFTKVFVGTMEQPEFGLSEIVLKVRDRQAETDIPLQTTLYAGDNSLPAGLEGTADDLKGKPKPICYGVVKNIDPPQVNTSKLIYQVNDGAIDSLDGVYDRGVNLTRSPASWTSETSGTAEALKAAGWGDSIFIAAGANGTLLTSSDGSSWTSRTSSFGSSTIRDVAYSSSLDLWVAVGDDQKIATSSDGISWSQQTNPFASGENVLGVAWGAGPAVFVAVGSTGTIATSSDGASWTSQSNGFGSTKITDVAFGRNIFVAVGDDNTAESSPGGVTWTTRDPQVGAIDNVTAIAFGRGKFVYMINVEATGRSLDGKVLTFDGIRSQDFEGSGITFADAIDAFIAVGAGGAPDAKIRSSRDGLEWIDGLVEGSGDTPRDAASSDSVVIAVGDSGSIRSMDASGTYASEADLLDDDLQPEPGTYKVYKAGGYFRLGSPPDGQVTADVTQGAAASDRTAAQLWTDVLTLVGLSSSDWSGSDVTALDTDNSAVLGYWSGTQEVRASEVLTKLAQSVGAWWGVDREGVFRIQRVEDPDGSATVFDITEAEIVKDSLRRVPVRDKGGGIPPYRVKVRYDKNYTVQSSDIAAGVSDARRARITQEWREESDEDTSVQTTHLLATEMVVDTLLSASADASTEASRLLTLRKTRRDRYELVVPYLEGQTVEEIDLGDIVGLTHSRYGLSGGVEALVISVEPDAREHEVRLGVWK